MRLATRRYRPATQGARERWKYAIDCVLHDIRSKRASKCVHDPPLPWLHPVVAVVLTAWFRTRQSHVAERARQEFRDMYVLYKKMQRILAMDRSNKDTWLLLPPQTLPEMSVNVSAAPKRRGQTVTLSTTKTIASTLGRPVRVVVLLRSL